MCFSSVLKATIQLILVLIPLVPTGTYANEIEGGVSAIDGDSLNMQIPLFGIDRPEAGQVYKDAQARDYPCGQVASDALARLIQDKIITCEVKARDRYDRPE